MFVALLAYIKMIIAAIYISIRVQPDVVICDQVNFSSYQLTISQLTNYRTKGCFNFVGFSLHSISSGLAI